MRIQFKLLVVVVLMFGASNANSQNLKRDSLIGIWICQEASVIDEIKLSKDEHDPLLIMKSAVVSSKFIFKSNDLFEWHFSKGSPAVIKGMNFFNNKKWSIKENENLVYIGPRSENLMQINVMQKEGITYFILSDIPLLLRMEHQH